MFDFIAWVLGKLTATQWDAWRNWLATLGGLAALLIASRTYVLNSRSKREEQPRKVYGEIVYVGDGAAGATLHETQNHMILDPSIGEWKTAPISGRKSLTAAVEWRHYEHSITNSSSEIIGPVQFTEFYRYKDGTELVLNRAFMVLKPDDKVSTDSVIPGSPTNLPRAHFVVTFRDSGGQWWSREGTDPINAAKPLGKPRLTPRKWWKRQKDERRWQRALRAGTTSHAVRVMGTGPKRPTSK